MKRVRDMTRIYNQLNLYLQKIHEHQTKQGDNLPQQVSTLKFT